MSAPTNHWVKVCRSRAVVARFVSNTPYGWANLECWVCVVYIYTEPRKQFRRKFVTRELIRQGKLDQRPSLLSVLIRSQTQQDLQWWHEGAYCVVALAVRALYCNLRHETRGYFLLCAITFFIESKKKAPKLHSIRWMTNTPRRHRLADGQLSSLYPPSPTFSSFGAASCDIVVFPSSSLVEHTHMAVCVLLEYYPGRKYNVHSYILRPSKCPLYFRPDLYRFEGRLKLYGASAAPRR